MDKNLIEKLNKLNQVFYEEVAQQFSTSRSYYWSGWQKSWDWIIEKKHPEFIVDVGCGDGRFAAFLQDNNFAGNYLGVDYSAKLLEIARARALINSSFVNQDLLTEVKIEKPADLLVCFGVMHHIPGKDTRIEFLKKLAKLINKDGLLLISFWQFLKLEEYQKKVVPWEELSLDESELEANDYLLGWNKGKVYRYCHYFDDNEIQELADSAGLKIELKLAGEKNNDETNSYLILSK